MNNWIAKLYYNVYNRAIIFTIGSFYANKVIDALLSIQYIFKIPNFQCQI